MLEHILQGIGGALKGGFDGYSWAKGREDDELRRKRDEKRYDEEQARRREDTEYQHSRDKRADATRTSDKAEADMKEAGTKAAARAFAMSLPEGPFREAALAAAEGVQVPQQLVGDLAKKNEADTRHTTVEADLPEHLREPYHASGHTQSYQPNDYLDFDEQERRRAVQDQRTRNSNTADYRTKKGIDREFAELPIVPRDDPSMPNGVRQYIAGLPGKHLQPATDPADKRTPYQRAFAELQQVMPQLIKDHPKLDARRLAAEFDAMWQDDQRPQAPLRERTDAAGGFQAAASTAGAVSTASTPPPIPVTPRGAQPPPAAASPLATPAATPETAIDAQARALLTQYRAEQDPMRKAALWAEIQRLKQQRGQAAALPQDRPQILNR